MMAIQGCDIGLVTAAANNNLKSPTAMACHSRCICVELKQLRFLTGFITDKYGTAQL